MTTKFKRKFYGKKTNSVLYQAPSSSKIIEVNVSKSLHLCKIVTMHSNSFLLHPVNQCYSFCTYVLRLFVDFSDEFFLFDISRATSIVSFCSRDIVYTFEIITETSRKSNKIKTKGENNRRKTWNVRYRPKLKG